METNQGFFLQKIEISCETYKVTQLSEISLPNNLIEFFQEQIWRKVNNVLKIFSIHKYNQKSLPED